MRLLPLPNPPAPPTAQQRHCVNCGAPESSRFCKGRCRLCYAYFNKRGVERPLSLPVNDTPYGREQFCECGQPATEWLPIKVGDPNGQRTRPQTLALCETCAALERRLSPVHSWKGER